MNFQVKDIMAREFGFRDSIYSTAVLTATVNEGWLFKKEVEHTFTCKFFYYFKDGRCNAHFLLDHNTDEYLFDRKYQDQAAYAISKYFKENQ